MKRIFFLLFTLLSFYLTSQDQIPTLSQVINQNDLLISGHRVGYYKNYPENSLSGMQYIYAENKSQPIMFEVDIREDKEGNLWLLHDDDLSRTTNTKGFISKKNYNEARKILLKNQNGTISNEGLPMLENVFEFIKNKHIYLMIDIKNISIEKVLKLANKFKLSDRCLVLTFTLENSLACFNTESQAMISVLVNSYEDLKAIQILHIPKNKIAAYVTDNTPSQLIGQLALDSIPLVGDPREVYNGLEAPQRLSFYEDFITKLHLDVIVSDFPIEVIQMLENKKALIQQINDIHLKKFQWLATKQIDSLSHLLHDDVYYIHSNGWQETKSEVLANIQTEKLQYKEVKVHESDVRIVDQTAIVTGKGTFYVSMDGKSYEFNLFYTEVYVQTEKGIKLLSRHACKY